MCIFRLEILTRGAISIELDTKVPFGPGTNAVGVRHDKHPFKHVKTPTLVSNKKFSNH